MSSLKVSDVMSHDVAVCRASDSLDVPARLMWERDCGLVPVVDATGGLIGVVTDRDVCMAGYIGGARLAEIPVGRAMAREVATVGPDDELARARALLGERALHRLPVVDEERRLLGIVSLADLVVVAAGERRVAARRREALVLLETLASVKRPRRATEPVVTLEPQPAKRARRKSAPSKSAAPKSAPSKSNGSAKSPAAGSKRRAAR